MIGDASCRAAAAFPINRAEVELHAIVIRTDTLIRVA